MSGEHRHQDYEDAIIALGERVTALEQGTVPPEPEPEPPKPTGGEAKVNERLGIRTPGVANIGFDEFTKPFGRTVKFYRAGGAHNAEGANLSLLTGNMWSLYVPNTDVTHGFFPKHPTVIGSQILPMITGRSISVLERAKRMKDTIAGMYDAKWDTMLLEYVGQSPPQVHRFNVSNEPDNANTFAYRLPDETELAVLPIALWRDCFSYIADKVSAAGHSVVMTGNGGWHREHWPGNMPGWEWAGCFDSYDIFAQNFYWNEPGTTNRNFAFSQLTNSVKVAKDLGKPVAFPEYGVAQYVTTATPNPITNDKEVIDYFNEVWDYLATLPASGPGSLDHHNVWHENGWKLRPAVFEAFKDRFGG